jgi:hypothetical protein
MGKSETPDQDRNRDQRVKAASGEWEQRSLHPPCWGQSQRLQMLFFWWEWDLNSGLHSCKAGATPPVSPFFSGCILEMGGSHKPELALILDPTDFRIIGPSHQCPVKLQV